MPKQIVANLIKIALSQHVRFNVPMGVTQPNYESTWDFQQTIIISKYKIIIETYSPTGMFEQRTGLNPSRRTLEKVQQVFSQHFPYVLYRRLGADLNAFCSFPPFPGSAHHRVQISRVSWTLYREINTQMT